MEEDDYETTEPVCHGDEFMDEDDPHNEEYTHRNCDEGADCDD